MLDKITFGEVCAGISGMGLGFEQAGMKCAWRIENDSHCQKLLRHHYPNDKLYDDLTRFDEYSLSAIDLLCGGTPCQGFSIAGKRGSLKDERSNLCFDFCELADQLEPALIVWENVPGCLSLDDNAFGCFLAKLAGHNSPLIHPRTKQFEKWWKDGTGSPTWPGAGMVDGAQRFVAWRILDSQFFGVAQRRQRVVVVAGSHSPRRPLGEETLQKHGGISGLVSEILFESEMLPRNTPPSREEGQNPSSTLGASPKGSGPRTDYERMPLIPEVSRPLIASTGAVDREDKHSLIPTHEISPCLQERHHKGADSDMTQAHIIGFDRTRNGVDGTSKELSGTLRSCSAKTDGVNNGKADNQCIAFQPAIARGKGAQEPECSPPLTAESDGDQKNCVVLPIHDKATRYKGGGVERKDDGSANGLLVGGESDPAYPIGAADRHSIAAYHRNASCKVTEQPGGVTAALKSGAEHSYQFIKSGMMVRRLTPVECERLQGFDDDYTNVAGLKDSPRYRMLGNAVTVSVFRWLGKRITTRLKFA